jgi:hypothetical protein
MLNVEQIAEWRGQDVLDAAGERIGKLDEVFYASSAGEAAFARVTSGLLGRHACFVPLKDATVGREHVRVAYSGEQIERSGKIEAGKELSAEAARELSGVYGLELAPQERFESATAISERQERAEEAQRRAEELERQARSRTEEATEAHGRAAGSARDAQAAEDEAEEARRQAEEARHQADLATPPVEDEPRA